MDRYIALGVLQIFWQYTWECLPKILFLLFHTLMSQKISTGRGKKGHYLSNVCSLGQTANAAFLWTSCLFSKGQTFDEQEIIYFKATFLGWSYKLVEGFVSIFCMHYEKWPLCPLVEKMKKFHRFANNAINWRLKGKQHKNNNREPVLVHLKYINY